jgi:predicted MFS family arabinose efflux permease
MLTTWFGWRSVFLVNVPVGLVAGVLSLYLVPRADGAARAGRELDLACAENVIRPGESSCMWIPATG